MCGNGRLALKLGRFGAFIGCSNYPECKNTRQLSAGADGNGGGMRKLGEDPETSLDVTVRSGRFGATCSSASKARMAKPKAQTREPAEGCRIGRRRSRSRDQALSLPRSVGPHPDDSEDIVAGIGRFGPYVKHGKTYANLEPGEDVLTIGLNRAVTLIEEKKLNPGKGRRFGADPGRDARRASAEGRQDRCEERPLRALCQPRRHQRQPAQRQDARHHHPRRCGDADRCSGRTRRRRDGAQKAAGPASRAEQGGRSPKQRRRTSRRSAPPRAARPRSHASRSQRPRLSRLAESLVNP